MRPLMHRRVQRIIDECVRKHGVEPLEDQAMVQIYGSLSERPIGQLADRLDSSAAYGFTTTAAQRQGMGSPMLWILNWMWW